MNQSNRKKKTQQLEISKLDEMLWLSTPLGKLMNSINKNRVSFDFKKYRLKIHLKTISVLQ